MRKYGYGPKAGRADYMVSMGADELEPLTQAVQAFDLRTPEAAGAPADWWNGGASPEAIRATAGRLLAFITKHARETPDEMPLLHDVHVLVANATHKPRKP